MKKVLFFLVFSLLFGSASIAQVKFGATAGFNAANLVVDDKDADVFNTNRYGFIGGLVADISINKKFSIMPELLYIEKGAGISGKDENGNTLDITMNLDYIQIPVNLAYKFHVGRSSNIFLFAGPYFGYAFSANWKGETIVDGEKEKKSEKIDLGKGEDELNPLDIGFVIGLGFQYGQGFFKLQVISGSTNLNNFDSYTMTNGGIALSAGYYF